MGTKQAGFRRVGWQAYRQEVGMFVGPQRRAVLGVVAVVAGGLAGVGADALLGRVDGGDPGSAVTVAFAVAIAFMVVGLTWMGVIATWWRRDRKALPAVSWRDDRLVVDYSEPDAPELSAVLAPRLLGSARKQRFDGVGSLTMLLPSFAAVLLGGLTGAGVTVAAGLPITGLVGGAFALVSMPLSSVRSFDLLGRAVVAERVALAHPAGAGARGGSAVDADGGAEVSS